MRAIYLEGLKELSKASVLKIEGERAHHLLSVARIKVGEDLFLFNGKGLKLKAVVMEIRKKDLSVNIFDVFKEEKSNLLFDAAICLPKKNAFDEIIKISVELGLDSIIPINSEYSTRHILNKERIHRVLESALIQSNNPFLPDFKDVISLKDLKEISKEYDKIFYFSSVKKDSFVNLNIDQEKNKILLVIGPEGGLSPFEERFLNGLEKIQTVHLPTPILRAPHALATSVGYLLGCYQK
jgi:16S rRNA (uracil1498-N3)-methyltransferase